MAANGEREPATLENIDRILEPDGKSHYLLQIRSDSEEAAMELAGSLGSNPRKVGEIELRGSTTVGFSGSWKNCNWHPSGPEPNWRKPPKDPSLN